MRSTVSMRPRQIDIIFSLTNDMPYTSALYVANIPTLADRREQLSRKFFKSVLHPTFCLHSLLPPPRDPDLLARLRAPSKFPRTATRTTKYQPFLSHATVPILFPHYHFLACLIIYLYSFNPIYHYVFRFFVLL